MTIVRGSQLPSVRLHLKDRELIDKAAKAAGMSVTEWARDILLAKASGCKAKEPEMPPSKTPPKRTVSGVRLKAVVPPEPPKKKGLELDEETALLLAGGRPPISSV